jgi:hypothetical protein
MSGYAEVTDNTLSNLSTVPLSDGEENITYTYTHF